MVTRGTIVPGDRCCARPVGEVRVARERRAAVSALAPGVIVGGRYRLQRVLARGGMGSVWVGWHTQLDVPVAVKFMDPLLAADPAARERFEREAKSAAQLRSPHVVQVLDYGVENDRPFLVMERLEGEDLRDRLRRVGRLSLESASRILNQCCKALRLAADRGIVHRDLKPGNIFLAKSGGDEVVKILDFGVAKTTMPSKISGDSTQTGVLLGSPHYMSPEQARGARDVDHRSDLWSMGVILFHVVTGKKPFEGAQLGDVIVKICSDPLPRASDCAPDLPPSVDYFFQRALERQPEQRFQSAREMAASFQAIVAQHVGVPERELLTGSLALSPEVRRQLAIEAKALTGTEETGSLPEPTTEKMPPVGAPGRQALPAALTGSEGSPEEAGAADPGPGEKGTLSSAAGTMDATPANLGRRPYWPWLGAALALATGGVAAVFALSPRAGDDAGAVATASAPASPPPASGAAAAEDAGSGEASATGADPSAAAASAGASAGAAPKAPVSAGTRHPAKAHHPATAAPSTRHPVLGI
jgi:eukaryotic-like serine/threonine-protein kinase